jgi:hypothetical protein
MEIGSTINIGSQNVSRSLPLPTERVVKGKVLPLLMASMWPPEELPEFMIQVLAPTVMKIYSHPVPNFMVVLMMVLMSPVSTVAVEVRS